MEQVTLPCLKCEPSLVFGPTVRLRMLSITFSMHLLPLLHTSFELPPFTPHERNCVIFGYSEARNKAPLWRTEDFFLIQDSLKLWEDCEMIMRKIEKDLLKRDSWGNEKNSCLGGNICEKFFLFFSLWKQKCVPTRWRTLSLNNCIAWSCHAMDHFFHSQVLLLCSKRIEKHKQLLYLLVFSHFTYISTCVRNFRIPIHFKFVFHQLWLHV